MPASPTARAIRNSLPALSIALFAAALTQPAFYWGDPGDRAPGAVSAFILLLEGWRGLPAGYLEWLANPLLVATWLAAAFERRVPSLVGAGVATLLMLVFPARGSALVLHSGMTQHLASLGAGYWLWLGSALTMVVAQLRTTSR